MNEQIDWGNAPEGATHYVPAPNDLHHPIWLKIEGGTVLNAGYMGHAHWAHTYTRGSQPCTDLSNAIARPTTPSWSGEGLPPVGVECDMHHEAWPPNNWPKVTVKYASAEYFITEDGAGEQHWHAHSVKFRPIRTPEQIEADEREAAIKSACADIDKLVAVYNISIDCSAAIRATIEALHDAGYRKP